MTQTAKYTDSVCDDKMSAYMFKLHEIDCEILKIYIQRTFLILTRIQRAVVVYFQKTNK